MLAISIRRYPCVIILYDVPAASSLVLVIKLRYAERLRRQ